MAGKATIERLVEERAFEKERKKKVRLIKEGIRSKFFQQGSGPGDILNFAMYEDGGLGMCTFVIRLVENGQRISLSLRCGS